jgi:hypothetical protein
MSAYLISHADRTGAGKAKLAQREAVQHQLPVGVGAERFSNADAWAVLRARGWGAVQVALRHQGHFVARRTGKGRGWRALAKHWTLYDPQTWEVIWTSGKLDLSRVVADCVSYLQRFETGRPRQPMSRLVAARLRVLGKHDPRPRKGAA